MVQKTYHFQTLLEITIIHCFFAIYCQNSTKKHLIFKCFQKLQLSIALLQFTFKMVLKSFDFQMLIEIIHCFIAIYCQNGTKNI